MISLSALEKIDPELYSYFEKEMEHHESNFVESGCRLQSELGRLFEIRIPSPGSFPLWPPL